MLHLEHRTAKMEDILLVDLRIEFAEESIHGSLPEIRRQEIRGSVEQYFAKTIPQLEYLCILCFHRQELAGMGAIPACADNLEEQRTRVDVLGTWRICTHALPFVGKAFATQSFTCS